MANGLLEWEGELIGGEWFVEWEGELMGGEWFTWEMGWKIGLWWHMVKQMDDGSYKI